ncbi:MAG TPA: metal ABC transporter ATP-binding protein [Oscillatoriales cyanobacterium M59_W2019_021]|nr:MAG: metal ABC transporter ATP-binding protein [Cyanobacteria bacterium J055]HIK30483.1 metal ABC transporter ATP-binding protein [Oscillatoriales cyanobacterium M4454_W2019_049]HIK49439.1 metal ABC transporter ATP-binding protein [Oscillatoriales cyanobacterium M59_W2019_021]
MLEVRNLAVSYRETEAVRNVSFCLQPGEVTALLGPNGAGKSTLVQGILGLIPIDRGSVKWQHRSLKDQLKKIAYVPQRTQIDWDYPITVQNVVMMGRIRATGWFRSPSRRSREIVNTALQRVEMWEYRQRQIRELSGGQQQRVFLARALAQEADLFFFDEPFAGVDRKTEEILFNVFDELKEKGKTILVISHDLGETLDRYDRLLLLDKELIASGSKQEVITAENLRKVYGRHLQSMA